MDKQFAFVMSSKARSNFDYVGIPVSVEGTGVVLKNPLVFTYGDDLAFTGLAPAYLPLGIVNLQQCETVMTVPMEEVAYVVVMPYDITQPVIEEYDNFFKQEQDTSHQTSGHQ